MELIQFYSTADKARIEACLAKLLPYLDLENTIIVGGLAIRFLAYKNGLTYPLRRVNDLDVIIKYPETLSPGVGKEFLIYHVHKVEGRFFYAIVDPINKLKIDMFDFGSKPTGHEFAELKNYRVKVATAEDQLKKTVEDVQRISALAKVEPKQFDDARLLLDIAKRKDKAEIVARLAKAEAIRKDHPDWVTQKPFRREVYECKQCVVDERYPITPMREIYKILGYAE